MGNMCVPKEKPRKVVEVVSTSPGGRRPSKDLLDSSNISIQLSGDTRPLPPVPQSPGTNKIVRALFHYEAMTNDDISFRKGDRLELIEDTGNLDWWLARNLSNGEEGYIPSNYVAPDDDMPEGQDWFFRIERRDAERLMLAPGNPRGTFLIRGSSDKKSFALSIRDYDEKKNEHVIKHYRIKKMDNGGCWISPRKTFRTINELVDHYATMADGLCYRLVQVCPRERPVVAFKDLEIDRHGINLVRRLGSGMFGDVWAGKWRGNVDVAVKTLKQGAMSTEAFLDEARAMHTLRHKNLVQLLAVCTEEEPIYIITELMIHGSLLDHLRADRAATVTYDVLIDMSTQIACGMSYLEEMAYVHRDLRAANILVGENKQVKVADFGLARLTFKKEEFEGNVYEANENAKFPIKWTAPEAAFERKFSVKSDVWSFGILLYELVTYGRIPYPGMTGTEVLTRLDRGYRMQNPHSETVTCTPQLYDIMQKCWERHPESRPTFAFLYSYFDDFPTTSESSYAEQN